MVTKFMYLILITLLLSLVAGVHASDKAKEKRWADQVVDNLMVGDAVWLQAKKDRFLGLYVVAKGKRKGAAIIMHGVGVHPNWTDVVQPIRNQLPQHGWTTLSIQMPILKNEAKFLDYAPLFDEVAPRINAAIALLKKRGHKNIILIGHSLGNDMAVYYLSKDRRASRNIKALVAISFTAPRPTPLPGKNALKLIKNVSIPMYDLYGTEDKVAAPGAAVRKKNGSLKGRYDQKSIAGAGHFFRDQNETLIKLVLGWITAYGK